MGRLRRFGEFRYVGVRDTMVVYDCDDEEQFAALSERVGSEELVAKNLLSSFAPDEISEARNRGFKEWKGEGSK
jgi:nitrate reductase beta subunit